MMRWEYMAIQVDWRPRHAETVVGTRVDRHDDVEAVLNELGADGWEAVAIDAGSAWRVLLKRPVT